MTPLRQKAITVQRLACWKRGCRQKENIAEKLIRELKIKVLQFHAEVCMKLGWYDKALEDYAKLAELGVDMTAENQKILLHRMKVQLAEHMYGTMLMKTGMLQKCN